MDSRVCPKPDSPEPVLNLPPFLLPQPQHFFVRKAHEGEGKAKKKN